MLFLHFVGCCALTTPCGFICNVYSLEKNKYVVGLTNDGVVGGQHPTFQSFIHSYFLLPTSYLILPLLSL